MAIMSSLREKWSDLQLQTKLILTFLLTVFLVIAVITAVISVSTKMFFANYIHLHTDNRTTELKHYFEVYYQKNNRSWDGVQQLLSEQPFFHAKPPTGGSTAIDRIILVDDDNRVIADSEGEGNIGKKPALLESQRTASMNDGNKVIGKIILGVNPPPGMATLKQRFFQSVTASTLFASLIGAILAIWLSLKFSRRISIPLVSLTQAAEKMADKDFNYRLFIPASDEIGVLARKFNSMADAIEKNEKIRNQLIADVAHELRTPITILRGSLESLQAGVMEPSQEVIVSLHDEVLRLSRLINELQEITLAESGKMLLNRQEIKAADIVQRVVTNFQGAASGKDIRLHLVNQVADSLVKVDIDRMIQVLSNIVGNAVRHTPPGGEIEVSVKDDADFVVFAVADSGSGISPGDLPHIFDRFYRGSKSRSRSDGGAGLGLAIAKSLVELHQGKIEVQSPPGGGSIFKIYIPD